MQIEVLKSKIHRVKVTGADLDYIGSITIDEALLEAANMIEGEKVSMANVLILILLRESEILELLSSMGLQLVEYKKVISSLLFLTLL